MHVNPKDQEFRFNWGQGIGGMGTHGPLNGVVDRRVRDLGLIGEETCS